MINDSGFKNEALQLTDQELLQNIRALQAEANIHQSDKLVAPLGRCSLDIEMETGTGKTYVYIKTMFELNKRYGWSKFIVVVPSIAIREGVKKSFEITADHFMECYGKKARFFIYNSSNLNQLDSFSSNSGINVMIINTQAFAASMNEDKNVEGRKGDAAARIIYTKRDEFGSRRPIDVIAANRPILILDEPTSQLDPIAASDFLAVLGKINRELGTAVVLTEHRLEEALPLCDRVRGGNGPGAAAVHRHALRRGPPAKDPGPPDVSGHARRHARLGLGGNGGPLSRHRAGGPGFSAELCGGASAGSAAPGADVPPAPAGADGAGRLVPV